MPLWPKYAISKNKRFNNQQFFLLVANIYIIINYQVFYLES